MNARAQELETAREEQILASARKLFAEKGYERTTVSEIVKDAGIAQGTFYLYFSSKRDTLVHLSRLVSDAIRDEVFAADDPDLPVQDRLRSMAEAAFRVCDENRDLAPYLHWTERDHEHIRKPLAETLARGMRQGHINEMDPNLAARFCQSLVEDAIDDCYVKGSVDDVDQCRESVVQFLIYALVKKH